MFQAVLNNVQKGDVIIHGNCRGADRMADRLVRRLGLEVLPFPVPDEEWELIGKRAGILRNQHMLLAGKPDAVLAFHRDLKNSTGTKDMVARARRARIQIVRFP